MTMASSPNTSLPSSPTMSVGTHHTSSSPLSTVTSAVFVVKALEKIASAKETRKNKELKSSVQNALGQVFDSPDLNSRLCTDMLSKDEHAKPDMNGEAPSVKQTRSTAILSALQMAIATRSANLMTIALDCLGKFITYNYLGDLENEAAQTETMVKVVDSICDCFIGEETDEKVQLQIIKTLLDAVYSTSNPVHQSALLKAVRTTYNIFLLSRNAANQNVAQVTLTQMVDHIFRRVKVHHYSSISLNDTLNDEPRKNESTTYQQQIIVEAEIAQYETGHKAVPGKKETTSEDFLNDTANIFQEESTATKTESAQEEQEEQHIETNEAAEATEAATAHDPELSQDYGPGDDVESEGDLFIKDAILVFRALCKLSKKPTDSASGNDMRSYSMRTKLLSLHLILVVLTSHMDVLSSPSVVFSSYASDRSVNRRENPFIREVKGYLCPTLGRNAFSVVQEVFDITLEILWKMIQGLRVFLKKELEVFFKEIFLRMLEMPNATHEQKYSLLKVILRICEDPKTLVDIYLNYDCDRDALDNIYERLVNVLSKITTSRNATPNTKDQDSRTSAAQYPSHHAHSSVMIPPPLTTATIQSSEKHRQLTNTSESDIKSKSLECIVSILVSLVNWYEGNSVSGSAAGKSEDESPTPRSSEDRRRSTDKLTYHNNMSASHFSPASPSAEVASSASGNVTPRLDNPEQFEKEKYRKQLLQEGIRQFNWKPKKGLQMLASHSFIDMSNHQNVARFFLHTEGLKKSVLGEYLGENEPDNIAIMHALVDEVDFTGSGFIDALRRFLQLFRLPGEAQKIDRFMEKFSDRYVHLNPGVFANGMTAYVLAFAAIMLNTDQHSPSVKRRMTLEDFIRNNRGIDDGADVSEDTLKEIFDEIRTNEIKMSEEEEAEKNAAILSDNASLGPLGMSGLQNALVSAGIARDPRREAILAATEEMGSKTEAIFKNILASGRRAGENETITFYSASHVEHVRPMFEVAWMAFLTGLSGPLQESDDVKTVELSLKGFKHAIRIVCLFHAVQSESMDLQRNAFVTTLIKFTFLSNLSEMKPKNVEAIKTLLEVATNDGNYLKDCWRDILSTVSQLDRFQLLTDSDRPEEPHDAARKTNHSRQAGAGNRRMAPAAKRPLLTEEVASAGRSQSLTKAVDQLFTATANLDGEAIVEFVKALCETSWEEIASSAHLKHPRMYSLRTLVEISEYNMNRIRIEWSNIWVVVGEYFNKVGRVSSFDVVYFAVDSLRQLSMKFLEKDELPHFKFQRDFLMPFNDILANNQDITIKDMVLRCLSMVIATRAHHIRSGWKTMFLVFATSASEKTESIVKFAFDIVKGASDEYFNAIVMNGTFPDYVSCLVEFAKNEKNGKGEFQKISLQALGRINDSITKMLEIAEKNKSIEINDAHALSSDGGPTIQTDGDFLVRFWMSVLHGLKEVMMRSSDPEVRKKAMEYLFDSLKTHGVTFGQELWESITENIVLALFDNAKDNADQQNPVPEERQLWLVTTAIDAMKNVIDLYTTYFESMKGKTMKQILNLFGAFIIRGDPNDKDNVLPEISRQCLYQYIADNVEKLDAECWKSITSKLVNLLEETTAHDLFGDTGDIVEAIRLQKENEAQITNMPAQDLTISEERKRKFKDVVFQQCGAHLWVVELVTELFKKEQIYSACPFPRLMELMEQIGKSFKFAKEFNENQNLRDALWKYQFMNNIPTLLKQETLSAKCYVEVLMKMYANLENIKDRDENREEIERALIPCCNDIFTLYSELDQKNQPKNVAVWTPVVVSILKGLSQLQTEDFLKHIPKFYSSAIGLLKPPWAETLDELRCQLHALLVRVDKEYKITQH